MTMLVGSGRVGDFVHAGQTMAKEQNFRNVSKLWYDKTISYEDGLQQLEEGKAETYDYKLPAGSVRAAVSDGGELVMVIDGQEFLPTPHALRQLSGVNFADCGTWTTENLRQPKLNQKGDVLYQRDRNDAETIATILENGRRRLDSKKELLFRTRTDGTLRAVMSASTRGYAIIDNRWYLELLKEVVPGGRLSHWRGDADEIYGNILIPDSIRSESDSDYGGGLSVGNSEIGTRRICQFPWLFRAICMNGNIWDRTNGKATNKVHRGKVDLFSLGESIKANIVEQIPLTTAMVDTMLATRRYLMGNLSSLAVIAAVAYNEKLSKSQGTAVYKAYGLEPDASLFGVVNAVTRAGQTLENEQWVNFDMIGGKMMQYGDKEWGNLLKKAESLEAKDISEMIAA